MSVEAMAWVLHHSPTSGDDKVVMLGIANHDGDGGSWPAIETLALYANKSERTVQRIVKRLEAAGHIIVHPNDGGTKHTRNDRRPNRYEIVRDGVTTGDTPSDVNGVTDSDHGVTDSSERGDNCCHPNRPSEPSIEPPNPPLPPQGGVEEDDGFAFFWSKYPRREAKATAIKAWKKLKPDEREAAVNALERWLAHHRSGRPQPEFLRYCPHPTTWINQRRWEDELPEGEALGAAARAEAAYLASRRRR